MANYISNEQLRSNFIEAREKGVLTTALAADFMKVTSHLAHHPRFNGYSYIDDMKGEALCVLCRKWPSFDPHKGTSAFGWVTSVTWFTFLNVITDEKKKQDKFDAHCELRWLLNECASEDPAISLARKGL